MMYITVQLYWIAAVNFMRPQKLLQLKYSKALFSERVQYGISRLESIIIDLNFSSLKILFKDSYCCVVWP